MRAAAVLSALAQTHEITLVVKPLPGHPLTPIAPEITALCSRGVVLEPSQAQAPQSARRRAAAALFHRLHAIPQPALARRAISIVSRRGRDLLARGREKSAGSSYPFTESPFDVIHVFRLNMLPVARAYMAASEPRKPRLHLDLDDIESVKFQRMAAVARSSGDRAQAEELARSARSMEIRENEALWTVDRVYVCSAADQAQLEGRSRAEICVLPNVVNVPEPVPPAPAGGPFTFLFIGTLSYFPNADAVRHFCHDIAPFIRNASSRPFQVIVVGTGHLEGVQSIERVPEVRLIGAVPDVRPWYEQANAVVIPIRAGGGTRIKALEAFGFRRPVVTTTIGIEGIDVEHGKHVLIADSPQDFANRCLELMESPALGQNLVDHAYALLTSAYTPEALAKKLQAHPTAVAGR
jgi:glycosyltransferase involved in cell wall biosynthesis